MDWAQTIILIGSICAAIVTIKKFIFPIFKKAVKEAIKTTVDDLHTTIKDTVDEINHSQTEYQEFMRTKISDVDARVEKIEAVNDAQTEHFKKLEMKIDENELDRIRQEFISFSKLCYKKEITQQDEFDHIF